MMHPERRQKKDLRVFSVGPRAYDISLSSHLPMKQLSSNVTYSVKQHLEYLYHLHSLIIP